jgi:hypothetical protein
VTKRDAPVPADRPVWTYFVTRDSLAGALSGVCQLWYNKPVRVRHAYRVTWVCADHHDPGHLGECSLKEVQGWFRTQPDTDLELIKAEQYASPKMLDDAKKEWDSKKK